jgi:hypothetical protein
MSFVTDDYVRNYYQDNSKLVSVYPQYGANGYAETPWQMNNKTFKQITEQRKEYNNPPSFLNKYGGIINGYQPSIIRPMDTVMVPKDIKRESVTELCKWPCYAGSKFQKWCSEENAINYHAMRPIVQPNEYNEWLVKLFNTIMMREKFSNDSGPVDGPDGPIWTAVFCDSTKSSLMDYIMAKITEGVKVIPEMHKNGSWGVEQFFWTDPRIFMYVVFANETSVVYYKVLFNLYNPLRSVSTEVECTITVNPKTMKQVIIYMGFISGDIMTSETDQIPGYNLPQVGRNFQINVNAGPEPTSFDWNYGNTLLSQQFNRYGFYEESDNVIIETDMSDTLKKQIKQFEVSSPEYLLGAGQAGLGLNGVPKTVPANSTNVYQSTLQGNKLVGTFLN